MEGIMIGNSQQSYFLVNENVGIKAIWLVIFNQDFMLSEKLKASWFLVEMDIGWGLVMLSQRKAGIKYLYNYTCADLTSEAEL